MRSACRRATSLPNACPSLRFSLRPSRLFFASFAVKSSWLTLSKGVRGKSPAVSSVVKTLLSVGPRNGETGVSPVLTLISPIPTSPVFLRDRQLHAQRDAFRREQHFRHVGERGRDSN